MEAAQRFEWSLSIFVFRINKLGCMGTEPDTQDYLDYLQSQPLGTMLKKLEIIGINFIVEGKELKGLLKKAKEYRNYIAHRFFNFNINFFNSDNLKKNIDELIIMRKYFNSLFWLFSIPFIKSINQLKNRPEIRLLSDAINGDNEVKSEIMNYAIKLNRSYKKPQIDHFPFNIYNMLNKELQ